MPISSSNAILNQYVPPFCVDKPVNGDILAYDAAKQTWTNTPGELEPTDIILADGTSITTEESENLVSYVHADDNDPYFPNRLIITIGAENSVINFDGMLFEPLVMKNDTAIQGWDKNYSVISNMLSITPDDEPVVMLGDGAILTALRSKDDTVQPVVRQGLYGSTTDYEIFHEGNFEAPIDGKQYARQDGGWTEVDVAGLTDAVNQLTTHITSSKQAIVDAAEEAGIYLCDDPTFEQIADAIRALGNE